MLTVRVAPALSVTTTVLLPENDRVYVTVLPVEALTFPLPKSVTYHEYGAVPPDATSEAVWPNAFNVTAVGDTEKSAGVLVVLPAEIWATAE